MNKWIRRDKKKAARKNKFPQHGRTSAEIAARMIVERGRNAEEKLRAERERQADRNAKK